jgi:cell wall-associated NlpC family hydrolase
MRRMMTRPITRSLASLLLFCSLAAHATESAYTPSSNAGKPLIEQLGDGFVNTTQTLASSLTDTVKGTVNGSVGLVGSVTAIVADTVSTTVTGTADVAGKVGGAVADGMRTTVTETAHMAGMVGGLVADGVKHTVSGTARVAGKVGGAVADGVRHTVSGTADAAGTVGGAVADTVRTTAFGTVRVAGTVTHAMLSTAGTTVNGAVRVADAVGTIVAGTVAEAARTLISVPKSMLEYATSLIGTPYKWGGTDADSGLDCSGFVLEVIKKSSTPAQLPRTAREMSKQGEKVDKGELKPGDLVFFNTRRRAFSHVGIYLGDDSFVHAASGKKSGKQVRIDRLSSSYYTKRYNGARRLADVSLE